MKKNPLLIIFVLIFMSFVIPISNLFLKSSHEFSKLYTAQKSPPDIIGFSENKLLSTDDLLFPHHVEVSMAISDNGTIFAGWKNADTHNGGGVRVSYAKSNDGGNSWSKPYYMPLFNGTLTYQSDPWLYWYNGVIYYAYLELERDYLSDPENGFSQITVAKSNNYGTSWTPVQATHGIGFADKETMIVSDNGTVFVVYDDINITDFNIHIRLSRSIDGGISYTDISTIDIDPMYVAPYIAISSLGHLFVAWSWIPDGYGNIFLAESQDMGASFMNHQMINQDGNFSAWEYEGGQVSKATLPVIKFDKNDRLYLLWADKYDPIGSTFDIYLRYSDNFGLTWSPRIQVNNKTTLDQWHPEMVIDSTGRLHIAYYSEGYSKFKPYYKTINFTGINRNIPVFSDEIAIADVGTSNSFTRPGEYLAIQLDSNEIPHIAWSDGRQNELDIFYAHGITPSQTSDLLNPIIIIVIIVIVGLIGIVIIITVPKLYKRKVS
jgi:hypothetical protein